MACFVKKCDVKEVVSGHGHGSWPMLGEDQGCANGCAAGISYYSSCDYTPAAVHDDQEGFYVISGKGRARIGNEEFELVPDMAFIAPAGTEHQIKSKHADEPVVVFWFHAQA